MDNALFSSFLIGLFMLGAFMYIIEPFMRARAAGGFKDDYEETPLHHLLSRKDSIYTALRDLEFDYQTGKLSDDDYESLRAKFTSEASVVLEEIDEMRATKPSQKTKKSKKGKKTPVETASDGSTCDECGFALKEGDKFCKSCGTKIA